MNVFLSLVCEVTVVAGGGRKGRIDVWRVSDFFPYPRFSSTKQRSAFSPSRMGYDNACCLKNDLFFFQEGPRAAVGAEVGVSLRRLLSAACEEEREVVYVSPRAITLWRVVRGHRDSAEFCESMLELNLPAACRKPRKRSLGLRSKEFGEQL